MNGTVVETRGIGIAAGAARIVIDPMHTTMDVDVTTATITMAEIEIRTEEVMVAVQEDGVVVVGTGTGIGTFVVRLPLARIHGVAATAEVGVSLRGTRRKRTEMGI